MRLAPRPPAPVTHMLGWARTLWRQFPPAQAIRAGAATVARRLLDRFAQPSYAIAGEDRVIEYLLAEQRATRDGSGFYVDVGCNEPAAYSNTFALYRRGWRGVTVDANPEMVARHRSVRPRDVSVCAVVSDETREMTFTEFEPSVLSSVDEAHVRAWSQKRRVVRRRVVAPRTLTSILDEAGAPARFDLLCVDAEGHDLNVLRSLDFERFRPRLVVAEVREFVPAEAKGHPIPAFLAAHGYELAAYVGGNAFFVDRR
jgi:FkbM family methyltransferase